MTMVEVSVMDIRKWMCSSQIARIRTSRYAPLRIAEREGKQRYDDHAVDTLRVTLIVEASLRALFA